MSPDIKKIDNTDGGHYTIDDPQMEHIRHVYLNSTGITDAKPTLKRIANLIGVKYTELKQKLDDGDTITY